MKEISIGNFSISWVFLLSFLIPVCSAHAELSDVTQTPNTINAGIKKSLTDQVGASRGDIDTPDSSLYIIKRDPFRAIARGRQLFQRKFQVSQGFGPRFNDGDGTGAFNLDNDQILNAGLVDSCAGCHGRPHGGAGSGGDVFTRPDSRDAPHLYGIGLVEMLADEITQDLRSIRSETVAKAQSKNRPITRRLKSKGIRYGKITAHPDGSVDTSRVKGVNPDLRVRPFLHQGGVVSIRGFIVGALQAEMGLQTPDTDHTNASLGLDVLTPSGMLLTGSIDDLQSAFVLDEFQDGDNDGVSNEVDIALVDYMEFYLLNYFKPALYRQNPLTERGKSLIEDIGCTSCHKPDLLIDKDRRVADVETNYDEENGIFNNMFAVAEAKFVEEDDGSGYPTLKKPAGAPFLVENIYTDLKRHDLGAKFWERNFDGTYQKEMLTEALWGVGTTAPYGHDGRSINLREVILRHGGEASHSTHAFKRLSDEDQLAMLAFLQSMQLFPPPDTASNLNPGDPSAENYPQNGHGSVDLSVLFLDPSDKE